MKDIEIFQGDALVVLKTMPDESVDMVMTSPPYWALRDYGVKGQLGLESTFQEYINKLCDIFDEVKRVLKKEGTCFVNLGDTYYGGGRNKGNKNPHPKGVRRLGAKSVSIEAPEGQDKCLVQIPSRFAIEMVDRGWIMRNEIIWHKPNCMPSSATDRFTVDFEKIYFFTKNTKYNFVQQFEPYIKPLDRWGGENIKNKPKTKGDNFSIKTRGNRNMRPNPAGRNMRSIWSINTRPFKDAHFATFPEELCRIPILAGCPRGGAVLDPFMGAGTTLKVALDLGRKGIGIEINPEYIKIAEERLQKVSNKLF